MQEGLLEEVGTWAFPNEWGGRPFGRLQTEEEALHSKTKLMSYLNGRGCGRWALSQWVTYTVVHISHGPQNVVGCAARVGLLILPSFA